MPSRRVSSEHQEAVSRRLAQLSADLAATRAPDGLLPAELDAAPEPAVGGEWWSGHTHVADARPALSLVAEDAPGPAATPTSPTSRTPAVPTPELPVPGRHAARRRGQGWGWGVLVPDSLRGHVALGAGPLAVLAAMVAIGLAATTWWVIRGDAGDPTPAVAAPGSTGGSEQALVVPDAEVSPSASTGAVTGAGGEVTVDVTGKVRRPGIAVLAEGDRVVDAIEAAGGARRGIDLSSVNLARVLVDGEQIVVGVRGGAAAAAPVPPTGATGSTVPSELVDLNLATQAELESLPEVGPVTATAILAWREQNGAFSAVEELLEVDGIGDATLAQLTPYVTV